MNNDNFYNILLQAMKTVCVICSLVIITDIVNANCNQMVGTKKVKKLTDVLNCNKICFNNWIMQIIVLSNGY